MDVGWNHERVSGDEEPDKCGFLDSQYDCDQEVMYVVEVHLGECLEVPSVCWVPNPRMLEQGQHIYAIAEESS